MTPAESTLQGLLEIVFPSDGEVGVGSPDETFVEERTVPLPNLNVVDNT